MRAHFTEPTLSWPSEVQRPVARPQRRAAAHSEWSSRNVDIADQPLARVAALLLSISQNNGYEGRDPETVPDAISSGFVADLLGVDIATLAAVLVDLQQRGLVKPGPNAALHLTDISGLARLAN